MKSVTLSAFLVLFVLATTANAREDPSKPRLSNIRAIKSDDGIDRQLSMWTSFMNFVQCPIGPLGGKGCSSSKSSSSSSGGGGSGGGSSASGGGSSSGGSSSGGGGSSNSSGGGGSSTSSSSSSSSSNSSSGGDSASGGDSSNGNYSSKNNGTGGSATASSARRAAYTWVAVLGGMALIATGVALIAHSTSKQNDASKAPAGEDHELNGSVKKRNKAFKTAMKKKLGWKKEVTDLEESLA